MAKLKVGDIAKVHGIWVKVVPETTEGAVCVGCPWNSNKCLDDECEELLGITDNFKFEELDLVEKLIQDVKEAEENKQ